MRDYAKISCSIWNSVKFRGLRDDDAKLLYFYLHTCPHVNSVGCFVLPLGYVATDMQWGEGRVAQALDRLLTASLAGWDEAENIVRIIGFLKQDPITNPSHAAGAVKIALQLPRTRQTSILFRELLDCRHVKDKRGLIEALDTLSTPSRHPEPEPEPEPEPDIGGGGNARGLEIVPEDQTLRERILAAIGVSQSGITGPSGRMIGTRADMEVVARWVSAGLSEDEVVAVVRETMGRGQPPPSTFAYFDKAMARLVAAKASPALQPATLEHQNGRPPSPASRQRLTNIIDAALNSARPLDE